ncbi:hypothetical protein C8Q72DRAFT_424464 [Fomitopsis betulina]|nr:hypothetical protein C8Q72DRAFT_424464 [Fomitopsis betulina]
MRSLRSAMNQSPSRSEKSRSPKSVRSSIIASSSSSGSVSESSALVCFSPGLATELLVRGCLPLSSDVSATLRSCEDSEESASSKTTRHWPQHEWNHQPVCEESRRISSENCAQKSSSTYARASLPGPRSLSKNVLYSPSARTKWHSLELLIDCGIDTFLLREVIVHKAREVQVRLPGSFGDTA